MMQEEGQVMGHGREGVWVETQRRSTCGACNAPGPVGGALGHTRPGLINSDVRQDPLCAPPLHRRRYALTHFRWVRTSRQELWLLLVDILFP